MDSTEPTVATETLSEADMPASATPDLTVSARQLFGVDTDMDHLAPDNVLSSMLKHVEVGTYYTIEDAYNGTFEPGFKTYTLADGTIGYTKSAEMAEVVPADLYAAVDGLAEKIKAGEIVVPMTVAEANVFTLE